MLDEINVWVYMKWMCSKQALIESMYIFWIDNVYIVLKCCSYSRKREEYEDMYVQTLFYTN